MPGMFGGVGIRSATRQRLNGLFKQIWNEYTLWSDDDCFLGGHALNAQSLFKFQGGRLVADGEDALYKNAAHFFSSGESCPFQFNGNSFDLTPFCKGNLAILDDEQGRLTLAVDWAGCFPLYYIKVPGGILFSSHIRPLARTVKAIPDSSGIIQFLKYCYIHAGRTYFRDIHRLQPGQILSYDRQKDDLKIYETSKVWSGFVEPKDFQQITENVWEVLVQAMNRCFCTASDIFALAASAGWDSRLLLAAIKCLLPQSRFRGYSHGDLNSRELLLSQKMFKSLNYKHHLNRFKKEMYDPEVLERGFAQIENVVNPFWLEAGRYLKKTDVSCIAGGMLGEVLGGHYGASDLMFGVNKIVNVASFLFKRQNQQVNKDLNFAFELLRLQELSKPWYISSEYWDSLECPMDKINDDIECSLNRLKNRGIDNVDQLIEAYNAEHTASKNLAMQLYCCRPWVNIAFPFADHELLTLSSRIPLSHKIHNSINRALIATHARELQKFRTAATLVPAGAPILVQEMSRVFRKTVERASWQVYSLSKGQMVPKFNGWDNFEFLRNGKTLHNLVDNIQSEFFNKRALERCLSENIEKIGSHQSQTFMQTVSHQFMKIYTIDLMMR